MKNLIRIDAVLRSLERLRSSVCVVAITLMIFNLHVQSAERPKGVDPNILANALTMWGDYVKERLKEGDDVEKVMKVMAPKTRDSGRIEFHGTGDYELVFKVDDFICVGFYIDRSGAVRKIGVAVSRKDWLKSSTGVILQEIDR